MSTIILYDFAGKIPGTAWNFSVWKTRFTLNYKGLAYKTEWVEYPDAQDVLKKLGAPPFTINADGTPHYTLPTIYDPSTDKYISDSILIAEYLDKTYPKTPKVLVPGTRALTDAFADNLQSATQPLAPFAFILTHDKVLNPVSAAHMRKVREAMEGKTLEELVPVGEAKEKHWAQAKDAFGKLKKWLDREAGPFVMGNEVSFADFALAALFTSMRLTFGADSEEWRKIMSWNDGYWSTYLKSFAKWEVVV